MTHSLHGSGNNGDHNGFTALGKKIGTSKSTLTDTDYVTEHRVLKYLRIKIAHYLHDYRRHWFAVSVDRNTPAWWREAGENGTKQLYQPEPRPVVYVVPITSILGRLPLVPAGDHGTIPAAMRNRKKELFEYGKCDESAARPAALVQAASCTTSTRGPCAGPPTMPRGL